MPYGIEYPINGNNITIGLYIDTCAYRCACVMYLYYCNGTNLESELYKNL